jgi:hypothetical protein
MTVPARFQQPVDMDHQIGGQFRRRPARSNFSRFPGFEDVHREAVLDHRRKGIARTYDRHKYYAEKLALLTAWEERLRAVVEAAAPPMAPGDHWAASKAAATA